MEEDGLRVVVVAAVAVAAVLLVVVVAVAVPAAVLLVVDVAAGAAVVSASSGVLVRVLRVGVDDRLDGIVAVAASVDYLSTPCCRSLLTL